MYRKNYAPWPPSVVTKAPLWPAMLIMREPGMFGGRVYMGNLCTFLSHPESWKWRVRDVEEFLRIETRWDFTYGKKTKQIQLQFKAHSRENIVKSRSHCPYVAPEKCHTKVYTKRDSNRQCLLRQASRPEEGRQSWHLLLGVNPRLLANLRG